MKRLIQTIQNIWKIEDLRNRILYTLGLVFIYRLGSYIVLPGVDPVQLEPFPSREPKAFSVYWTFSPEGHSPADPYSRSVSCLISLLPS